MPVFLRTRSAVPERPKRDLRSQHRSLAYDDLKEHDGHLADFRTAGKDLVGMMAEIAR